MPVHVAHWLRAPPAQANGDLWARLLPGAPCVQWVPAHLNAPGQEVSERDWHLNRLADDVARAAAHRLRVPAGDRAARCEDLRALVVVVHDIFAVEVAAFAAKCVVHPLVHRCRRFVRGGHGHSGQKQSPPRRARLGAIVGAMAGRRGARVIIDFCALWRSGGRPVHAPPLAATLCCVDVLFEPVGHTPTRLPGRWEPGRQLCPVSLAVRVPDVGQAYRAPLACFIVYWRWTRRPLLASRTCRIDELRDVAHWDAGRGKKEMN